MTDCPDYCRSDQQNRQYCRLQRGCVRKHRDPCPLEHSRSFGGGAWNITADTELGTLFKRNGTAEFRVRCTGCGAESSGIGNTIANRLMARGVTVTWTRTEPSDHTCSVLGCQRTDVEWHHFAPRNVFHDADNWPYMPLCVSHHRQWHRTMDGYRWNAKAPQLNIETHITEMETT